jgi:UDP-glucose 4-epimerase
MKLIKKTLVIGGQGFIGTYVVSQLLATGRTVTVLSRNCSKPNSVPAGLAYIVGDYSNTALIQSLLDTHQEVIHLAYASAPNTSFNNPIDDLLQNLYPTIQLFTEAACRGVKLVLLSSGGTVYGEGVDLPISETHTTKPISPYGITKLTLESYASLYAVTHGLKFVCVRPANAYGIGQHPFSGQGFVSTAIASALNGIPIKVFGDQGTIRDYIYVSDLASGIVNALEYGHDSEIYNIGTGIGTSNIGVIESFNSLFIAIGHEVFVENIPPRSFDVKVNILDSKKIMEHTGWAPKISFSDGLSYTFQWLRKLPK